MKKLLRANTGSLANALPVAPHFGNFKGNDLREFEPSTKRASIGDTKTFTSDSISKAPSR